MAIVMQMMRLACREVAGGWCWRRIVPVEDESWWQRQAPIVWRPLLTRSFVSDYHTGIQTTTHLSCSNIPANIVLARKLRLEKDSEKLQEYKNLHNPSNRQKYVHVNVESAKIARNVVSIATTVRYSANVVV